MKKFVSILMIILLVFGISSCDVNRSAYSVISEFMSNYGTRGRVYSFSMPEESGMMMTEELYRKLYPEATALPSDFAVMLNAHPDFGAECGVFVCRSTDERDEVTELAESRLHLLDPKGDRRLLVRSGMLVFYSTLSKRELAERLIYDLC